MSHPLLLRAARTIAIPLLATAAGLAASLSLRTVDPDTALRPLLVAVAASALFAGGRAATLGLASVLVIAHWLIGSHPDAAPLVDEASFAATALGLVACIVVARRHTARERRRARAARTASDAYAQRFRALFEVVPVGLAIVDDPDDGQLVTNPALRTFLGLPDVAPAAAAPLPCEIRRDGRVLSRHELPLAVAAVTGRAVDGEELEVRRADGTTLHLVASARPLFDAAGTPHGAVGAFLDVTAGKAAAAALRESEQRFRSVVESNMVGIVFADPRSGRITDANDAFLSLVGRTRAELERGELDWTAATAPEDRPHERQLARETPFGQVVPPYEKTWLRPDGGRVRALIGGTILGPEHSIAFVVDRTEHEAAAARLRESERRFRHVAESGMLAITFWDAETRLVEPTDAFLAMIGWPREEFLRAGLCWRDVIAPEHTDRHRAAQAELRAGGVTTPYETELIRRDGGRVPVLIGAAGLGGGDGVSFALDMTAQRRLEFFLAQQVEDLRTMLEIMPIGVAVAHDRSGAHVSVNTSFAEALGLGAARAVGHDDPDAAAPAYTPLRDGHALSPRELPVPTACRTGRQVLGARFDVRRADGSLRHFLANAAPLFDEDGSVRGAIGAHVDVTEMQRLEAALSESQTRLDLAQTAGGVGVFDWDMVADHVVWTHQLCRLFGIEPDGFAGTFDDWAGRLHPDDAAELRRQLRDAGARRAESLTAEVRAVLPDGAVRWLATKAHLFYDADGVARRMIGVHIDVTDRKRSEEALRESDRRKDEFLAMLAHELRNPLGPIRNAVELMRLLGPPDPRTAATRDLIDRQVTHLARLIDDLLDVSRITRGKIVLKREVTDLADAVTHAVEQARPAIEAKSQRLGVRLPAAPVLLEADAARLVQIVSNLLGNAAKYTEPGGEIDVEVSCGGDLAVVRVRDTGIGISPDVLPTVFDLFVQDAVSLDRSQGGLGIGLTLVRSLVGMHGGTVEARSEGRGHGSEFIVKLPALPARTRIAIPIRPVAEAAPAPGGLRVLVVEDNHDARESFVALLELAGHRVCGAGDGLAAVDVARDFRPHVAFLDLGLPRLDGYQLARRLRGDPSLASTVLIALSGYGREEDKRAAFEAGFHHHLTKPVDFSRVDELLAEVAPVAARGPGDAAARLH